MGTPLLLIPEILPASIVLDRPLSDEQLEELCAANDFIQLERAKDGEILMNPPTELTTTDGNSELNRQLRNWWITHRQGKVAESNGGFFLADGSMLSPDAAYIAPARLKTLPKGRRVKGFPHVCPNFVIELLSRSDSLRKLQAKMRDWVANGAEVAWLIDPYKRRVSVYQPGLETKVVTAKSIQGTGPIEGFTLDLTEVWRCYDL